jgi:DNA-directed RNA polymerase specialized sigma24 family protein
VRVALIESGTMSDHGFARLLERLHADAEQAAQEYERLRRGLVKFFDWRGVWPPDECADEVFDRLARKLEDTAVQDVGKYAHGIARLVALERRRRPAFSSIDDVQPLTLAAPVPVDDGHPLSDCFDRCLADMPDENRQLLLGYYEGERSAKISNRRRLASTLGVTEAALRSRVQRLRDRLEHCVQACAAPLASNSL